MRVSDFFNFKEPPVVLIQSRFPSLDGLRAISILMVVFYHAFLNPAKLILGPLGVSVFFVISGFLITALLLKEKFETGRISLPKFYARRALRIFPVAYLYLLVLMVLNYFFSFHISDSSFLSSGLYLRNTSIIFVPPSEWYTGHYWSLSAEEQFYLIFPFILTLGINPYLKTALSLLVIIPFSNYAFSHHLLGQVLTIVSELLRNLTGMLIGSSFAIFYLFGKLKTLSGAKYKGLVSILLLILAAFVHAKILPFVPVVIGQVMIAVVIILNIEPSDNFFFKFLNKNWMIRIGALSYSLYIWQQLFTNHVPWANAFPGASNVLLNLGALVLVSYLSYHYFEKPFLRFKNNFKSIRS